MAPARGIAGLSPDQPFAESAARVVGLRARELFEHSHGVLDTSDIERVHDMRVATRRLRAVLEIFGPCFPAKPHRVVLRDVKALADALGERRDPDVHIEALEGPRGGDVRRRPQGVRTAREAASVAPGDGQREPGGGSSRGRGLGFARPHRPRGGVGGMKARPIKGSTRRARWPTTPSAASSSVSTSSCSFVPGALEPGGARRYSTTCGSRPSACATCSS